MRPTSVLTGALRHLSHWGCELFLKVLLFRDLTGSITAPYWGTPSTWLTNGAFSPPGLSSHLAHWQGWRSSCPISKLQGEKLSAVRSPAWLMYDVSPAALCRSAVGADKALSMGTSGPTPENGSGMLSWCKWGAAAAAWEALAQEEAEGEHMLLPWARWVPSCSSGLLAVKRTSLIMTNPMYGISVTQ